MALQRAAPRVTRSPWKCTRPLSIYRAAAVQASSHVNQFNNQWVGVLGTERECQNRQAVRSRICALIAQKSAYTLILGELHSGMAPQAICVRAVRAAANH